MQQHKNNRGVVMGKIRKKPYIETNVEKIAMYYFDLAKVSSLEELEKSDYYKYFEQDKLNALKATKKKEFEIKEKATVKKDLVFTCSNCKKELGYQVINNFILSDLKFNYENSVLEIICSCEKQNSFFIPENKKQKELILK